MAVSSGGAASDPACLAEAQKVLWDELEAVLLQHHTGLRAQLASWIDRREAVLDGIAKGPAVEQATLRLRAAPAMPPRQRSVSDLSATLRPSTGSNDAAAVAGRSIRPSVSDVSATPRPSTGSNDPAAVAERTLRPSTGPNDPAAAASGPAKEPLRSSMESARSVESSGMRSARGSLASGSRRRMLERDTSTFSSYASSRWPRFSTERSSTYSSFLKKNMLEAQKTASFNNLRGDQDPDVDVEETEAPLLVRAKGRVQCLMKSAAYNNFICAVILVYIVTMGFEVEVSDRASRDIITHVQSACHVVFIVELLARFCAEGWAFFCGEEKLTNMLDLVLVILSLRDMVAKPASGDGSDESDNDSFENVMMFRVLRIIRVVRVIRVLRILRAFRPLRVLVHSICAATKPLAYALVLLTTIIYSFAVVFTEAARGAGSTPMAAYFGNLRLSMLTLFMSVSSGVSWELAYYPLHEEHWMYGSLFIIFVVFAQLAVLNVMTGQFCSSAIESSHRDDEEVISEHIANKDFYVGRFRSLFVDITAGDGTLTVDSLEETLKDDHMQAFFQSLGIKVSDAFTLFKLLDDGREHRIDLERFVEGCLKLRGTATAIGLDSLVHEVRWLTRHLDKHLFEIKELAGTHAAAAGADIKVTAGTPAAAKNVDVQVPEGTPAAAAEVVAEVARAAAADVDIKLTRWL